MSFQELVITTITSDEVMADIDDDGTVLAVYAYNDCDPKLIDALRLTQPSINPVFIDAEDPEFAYKELRKNWVIK